MDYNDDDVMPSSKDDTAKGDPLDSTQSDRASRKVNRKTDSLNLRLPFGEIAFQKETSLQIQRGMIDIDLQQQVSRSTSKDCLWWKANRKTPRLCLLNRSKDTLPLLPLLKVSKAYQTRSRTRSMASKLVRRVRILMPQLKSIGIRQVRKGKYLFHGKVS